MLFRIFSITFAILISNAVTASVFLDCSFRITKSDLSKEVIDQLVSIDNFVENHDMNFSREEYSKLLEQLIDNEMGILQQIYQETEQTGLLNKKLDKKIKLATKLIPSPGSSSTGDFFKVIKSNSGKKLLFFLGDGEGHDVVSAMGSIKMHQFFKQKGNLKSISRDDISSSDRMNFISENTIFTFPEFALSHVAIDTETGLMDYSSSGTTSIPGIFVLSKNGEIKHLEVEGKKIGSTVEGSFKNINYQLSDGDFVVMMSDGFYDTAKNFFKTIRHRRKEINQNDHFALSSWEEIFKEQLISKELSVENLRDKLEDLFNFFTKDYFNAKELINDDASVLIFQLKMTGK